jgi:Calpain family cysteine protease
LEPISDISGTQLTGLLTNVDSIYPEWSIASQNWHDNQDNEEYVKYPDEIKSLNFQSIRAILNLEAAESKTKTKDAKKFKDSASEIFTEAATDEDGRKIPKIICRDDDSIDDYYAPLEFHRKYSNEQVEGALLQDALRDRIQSSSDSSSTDENTISRATLQQEYDLLIAERDVTKEVPKGEETDSCMCSVFRIVSEFAQRHQKNTSDSNTINKRLLWNSIYPQTTSGKPVYNSSGKYAIKLFLGGKWRKVVVTDTIPMGTDAPAIASSLQPLELWPLLLSKAVYSVYTACG